MKLRSLTHSARGIWLKGTDISRMRAVRALESEEKMKVDNPPQAKPTGRDRRESLREAIDTSAVIFLIKIASRLQGRILDLSLGGCRIRTDERFPVGIYTRMETEFHLEGLPFRLGGVVQAIHDKHTIGIRFLDMSSRKAEQIKQLIEEIRAMREQGTENREQGTGIRE